LRLWDSPLKSPRCAAVIVGALAALVYANSLLNEFAYDDLHIITENTEIHQLGNVPHALTQPYWPGDFGRQLGLWRPVTTGLLGLQYAVSGKNPTLYHAFNVILNALVASIVVLLLAELMSTPAAFVGGLVFAVHPLHTEAVANVIGVAELLPAFLVGLACLVHLRGPERTGWGRALVIGVLYGLAFGAKESAVTLPGIIFLLDAARSRLGFRDLRTYIGSRWRAYLAMLVVAAAMLMAREQILGSIAHPFGPLGADILKDAPRIWTLAEVWSNYVRLLVFPMDLSADYSPNVIPISLGWNSANLVGLLLALLILVGALVSWRRPAMAKGRDTARAVGFGVVWFLITISPVSNVFFLSGVMLAERTMYVPSIGFAALVGWLFTRLARERRRLAWVSVAVVVALMGLRTWRRNPTWRDNLTVFGQLIADYPYSGRSQWVLGDLFFQQGRPSQGLVSYRAAINILGPQYQLITEISKKLITAKYYQASERLLHFAWQDHPEYSVAPALLAVIHSREDDPTETERYARIALTLDSADAVSWHLLSWALATQGKWREAAEAREAAIRQGEGSHWEQWVSLAYSRALSGDVPGAEVALDSARTKTMLRRPLRQIDSLKSAFEAGDVVLPDTSHTTSPQHTEGRGAAPGQDGIRSRKTAGTLQNPTPGGEARRDGVSPRRP
jgi:tetratricopeptide (TPR) repeat protein